LNRAPADALRDAREMAWHASTYASLDPDTLAQGTEARFSVTYCLIVLGEALNNIPAPIRAFAPDIPWRAIIDMRHVLVHNYWRIDYAIIHDVLSRDLDPLMESIDKLLLLIGKD
jgi:uncharacterized protein with HEPN domain